MATLVQADVLADLRRALAEITLSGEDVETEADIEDDASSNFSDADLVSRLLGACRWAAARVRAAYVPDLVVEADPNDFLTAKAIRLLGSRVRIATAVATRRTFMGHRKLAATGVEVSASYPVYCYEDHDLVVYPDGEANTFVCYVKVPDAVTDMDARFSRAVVQRAAFTCWLTLGRADLATLAQREALREIEPYLLPRITASQPTPQSAA